MFEILKHSLNTFFAKIFLVITGLISSIIIARYLGPAAKGEYYMINFLPGIVLMVLNLGISLSNIYYIHRHKKNVLIWNSIFIAIFWGISVFLITQLLLFSFRHSFFKNITLKYVIMVSALMPCSLFTSYMGGVLLGLKKIEIYNKIRIISAITALGFFILALVILKGGLLFAVIAGVCGQLITFLLYIIRTRYFLKGEKFKLNFNLMIQQIKYGTTAHLHTIFDHIAWRIDTLILNTMAGSFFVGIYTCAVAVSEVIWYLPGAVGVVLFPHIKTSMKSESIVKALRLSLIFSFIATIILLLSGKYLILALFGKAYTKSGFLIVYLLPGILILSIHKIINPYFLAIGKPLISAIIAGIIIVVDIPLNIYLIPLFKAKGAAIATTLSYFTGTLLSLTLFIALSGEKIKNIFILDKNDFKLIFLMLKKIFRNIKTKKNI